MWSAEPRVQGENGYTPSAPARFCSLCLRPNAPRVLCPASGNLRLCCLRHFQVPTATNVVIPLTLFCADCFQILVGVLTAPSMNSDKVLIAALCSLRSLQNHPLMHDEKHVHQRQRHMQGGDTMPGTAQGAMRAGAGSSALAAHIDGTAAVLTVMDRSPSHDVQSRACNALLQFTDTSEVS
jgi:hypothetical protein